VSIFHLVADYHGRGKDGMFVLDMIREAHKAFVDVGIRDEVTLLGSGGIIAAEHVPKAILCGLDAVALDTPLMAVLQAEFEGECSDRLTSRFGLPKKLTAGWGVNRLKNHSSSWRDQLIEILGAMGLREVRRLRGEMGRAMFMVELEAEAFAEVEGYAHA
jgi:glutamate synthase domain-containing protein 2